MAMSRLTVLFLLAAALVACGSGGETDPALEPEPGTAVQGEATPSPEATAAQSRGVRLVRVGNFDTPVYVTAPRGDRRRVFVVEQGGRIRVIRGGKTLATPFLDIRARVLAGGEQGLLSVAFPPDYADSGRFYVYFTERNGDFNSVYEFRRRTADTADAGSARLVLRMPNLESNHNGGLLLFGPDRLMYIGTGDGGGGGDEHGERGNAQDLGSLLGKLLRIDPRASGGRAYRVPSSNPFVGRRGARGEIYSYGLRNPWRFSFDRSTGDLSIGDVGQNAIEEISFVARGKGSGANFGWRPFEGRSRYVTGEDAPGHVPPVIERKHSAGYCSITGGVVVRDRNVPGLLGRYVFGDVCQSRILSARLRPGRAQDLRRTSLSVEALVSFGEDASGRVYAVSLNGPVYRIAAK
jgi:glucose/arabinose dehydrogenase